MVNDTTIIYGIMVFFVVLGGVLPFFQAEFGQDQQTISTTNIEEDISSRVDSINSISAVNVFFSIIKMFFWTFGNIPWLMDLIIFIPLRLCLVFLLGRNIWIGGGS